jgi:glycerol-3-phosphate dehydrogenase (NAD(P)+)
MLVISVPSKVAREVARQVAPVLDKSTIVVSTAKGIEAGSHKRMSQVLAEELGNHPQRIAALSGPSFAYEVLKGLPTAVTIASSSDETLKQCVEAFHFANFRVYTSKDLVGVEMGGVIKNVIALAAGLVDGAGMGDNARAALLTRGIVEVSNICVALGADKHTVYGLSGLGDLILTATGDLSRNRRVGLRLGRGDKLEEIIAELGQVAEAVRSAGIVVELARELKVDVPIIERVDQVVSGKLTVREAIAELLAREQKAE